MPDDDRVFIESVFILTQKCELIIEIWSIISRKLLHNDFISHFFEIFFEWFHPVPFGSIHCIIPSMEDESQRFSYYFFHHTKLTAFTLPYPVSLHLLDPFRPIESVEIRDKTICIFSNFEHPLPDRTSLDSSSTSVTGIIRKDFFIGKSCLTAWTIIDREILFICETSAKQFEKDPLRPFIVLWIGRVYHTIPVI